jgi:Thioredoxin
MRVESVGNSDTTRTSFVLVSSSTETMGFEPKSRATGAAAVALTTGLLAVLAACGGSLSAPVSSHDAATTRKIDALLAGIPQHANALGDPAAPLTLQYFGDVECANTREATVQAMNPIIRRWVRSGKLRIVFRSMRESAEPLEAYQPVQLAALAAGLQNKLWDYLEVFYRQQEELGPGEADSCYVHKGFSEKVAPHVPGLNVARWARDRREPRLAREMATDQRTAASEGFEVSPSLLIGRTGAPPTIKLATFSRTQESRTHPAPIDRAIERLLHIE